MKKNCIKSWYNGQVVAESPSSSSVVVVVVARSEALTVHEDNRREGTTSARHKSWTNAARVWGVREWRETGPGGAVVQTARAAQVTIQTIHRWVVTSFGGRGKPRRAPSQCCHGGWHECCSGRRFVVIRQLLFSFDDNNVLRFCGTGKEHMPSHRRTWRARRPQRDQAT